MRCLNAVVQDVTQKIGKKRVDDYKNAKLSYYINDKNIAAYNRHSLKWISITI